MARSGSFEMGLPPFRGAVRQIILASVVIYVVILLLVSFAQGTGQAVLRLGMLDPAFIREGWLWQFVTYAFMYVDPLDFVLSLVGIYFLGAAVEDQTGRIFTGCNVENATYGLTVCAERVARERRPNRVGPGRCAFGHDVAGIVDDVGVVAAAADHSVRAHAAVQGIGPGRTRERVVLAVANAGEIAGTGIGQLLDIGGQR